MFHSWKIEIGRGSRKGKFWLWMGWLCRSREMDWRWLTRKLDPSSVVFVSSAKSEIKIASNSLVCTGLWVMVTSGHTQYAHPHTHTQTHTHLQYLWGHCIKKSSWSAQEWEAHTQTHKLYHHFLKGFGLCLAQGSQKLFSFTCLLFVFALQFFLQYVLTWAI